MPPTTYTISYVSLCFDFTTEDTETQLGKAIRLCASVPSGVSIYLEYYTTRLGIHAVFIHAAEIQRR